MQFSAFGREIHCETTATRKVTVKPLRYIPLQEQVDNFSLIDIFVSDASKIRTCMVEVSSLSELNMLPTELSEYPQSYPGAHKKSVNLCPYVAFHLGLHCLPKNRSRVSSMQRDQAMYLGLLTLKGL